MIDLLSQAIQLQKASFSYQNQYINAIKLYFEKILKREAATFQLERSRREQKLPVVLSMKEIKSMFKVRLKSNMKALF